MEYKSLSKRIAGRIIWLLRQTLRNRVEVIDVHLIYILRRSCCTLTTLDLDLHFRQKKYAKAIPTPNFNNLGNLLRINCGHFIISHRLRKRVKLLETVFFLIPDYMYFTTTANLNLSNISNQNKFRTAIYHCVCVPIRDVRPTDSWCLINWSTN